MGFWDSISGFGKRGLQGMGRMPTDEEMALRERQVALQERDMASILQMRQEDLLNSQLARKQTKAELAAMNDFAVGHGFNFGQMRQMLGAAGSVRTLAEANLSNQQARSVAFNIEQAGMTVDEMIDQLLGKQALATGVPTEDLKTAMMVNQATQNAQTAQRKQVVDTFMAEFGEIERAYRGQSGNPQLFLFGMDDAEKATDEWGQLLASNPTMTPEAAFQQIHSKAAGLARDKFMGLSRLPQELRGFKEFSGAQSPNREAGFRYMLQGLLGMDQTPPELGVSGDRTTTSLNRSLEGLK